MDLSEMYCALPMRALWILWAEVLVVTVCVPL